MAGRPSIPRRFAHFALATALALAGLLAGATGASPPAGADATPAFSLTASASPATNVAEGDDVTFTFVATNTDFTDVRAPWIVLSTDLDTPIGCDTSGPLTAHQVRTCTVVATVTAADVARGGITRTAVMGDFFAPENVAIASAVATTSAAAPWFVQGAGATSYRPVAGESAHLEWTVTQVGSGALHDTTITTDLVGASAVTCSPALGAGSTIAVGGTAECTADYPLTQADIDAGIVAAGWQADTSSDESGPQQRSGTISVAIRATPQLDVHLSGFSPPGPMLVGEVAHLTLLGTNIGEVTVHGADLGGSLPESSSAVCSPALPTTLAPHVTVTCTVDHVVTQADVDDNDAYTITLTGDTDARGPVSDDTEYRPFVTRTAALTVDQTTVPASGLSVGTTLDLAATVTNSGTMTLRNLAVSRSLAALDPLQCDTALPARLDPGALVHCTTQMTVTQADVDAGGVVNTITANADDPLDRAVTGSRAVTATADFRPGLAVSVQTTPTSGASLGQVVDYRADVTNTGTVTLSNVLVSDGVFNPLGCSPSVGSSLAPGAVMTCTAQHTVTQDDMDQGFVHVRTGAGGFNHTSYFAPIVDTTIPTDSRAELTTSVTPTPATSVRPGQVVTYDIVATNSGTVDLQDVDLTVPVTLSTPVCDRVTPSALAPQATLHCSTTHTVTQAEADAGGLDATVTASGVGPQSAPVSDDATVTVAADTTPAISIAEVASPATGLAVGDTVTFSTLVTNTGAQTLDTVGVTHSLPGVGPTTCTPTAPATLASAATMTCSATYTVTQADFDAGAVVDTATATGTDVSNVTVTDAASASALMGHLAQLDITAAMSPDHLSGPGEQVTFTFTVTNTGDLPVHDVEVLLGLDGASPPTCTPTAPADLARGGVMVCTSTYAVTQADIEAGGFHLDVAALGSDPLDAAVGVGAGFQVTVTHGIVPDDAVPAGTDDTSAPLADTASTEAPLAFSGAETAEIASVAVAALLLGAGLLVASRRRRTGEA